MFFSLIIKRMIFILFHLKAFGGVCNDTLLRDLRMFDLLSTRWVNKQLMSAAHVLEGTKGLR